MGVFSGKIHFRSSLILKGAFFGLLASASSWSSAQSEVNFMSSFEVEEEEPPIGGNDVLAVGVSTHTLIPLSSGFRTTTRNEQDMRFQVPVGLSAELSWGLTRNLELAFSGGYERFETEQDTGLTSVAGGSPVKQLDVLTYTLYPVVGMLRYRWGDDNWSPELEVGGGAAFGSIKTRSTVINSITETKSGPFWRGHASVGSAFSWADDYTAHFHVGYGFSRFGNHTYETPTYTITQKSMQHGIFVRALVRYQF